MRRISFIITILGLISLIILFINTPIKTISSPDELSTLSENQKVILTGLVIKESAYYDSKIITLDNNLKFQCAGCPLLLNKNITAIGTIETYTGQPKINALKITER